MSRILILSLTNDKKKVSNVFIRRNAGGSPAMDAFLEASRQRLSSLKFHLIFNVHHVYFRAVALIAGGSPAFRCTHCRRVAGVPAHSLPASRRRSDQILPGTRGMTDSALSLGQIEHYF
jgi:hypothetical protein